MPKTKHEILEKLRALDSEVIDIQFDETGVPEVIFSKGHPMRVTAFQTDSLFYELMMDFAEAFGEEV